VKGALGAKIGCLGAMTKIYPWLHWARDGCIEAPLGSLGPRTTGLLSMENDFRPFDDHDKVV
jgi:hypothetical protein